MISDLDFKWRRGPTLKKPQWECGLRITLTLTFGFKQPRHDTVSLDTEHYALLTELLNSERGIGFVYRLANKKFKILNYRLPTKQGLAIRQIKRAHRFRLPPPVGYSRGGVLIFTVGY